MPYSKLEELPTEIKEQLPEHAQQIFMAAFNSAQSDGMSEEGALSVGWNSVKAKYEQGVDGKWQRQPEETKDTKAITSSGDR